MTQVRSSIDPQTEVAALRNLLRMQPLGEMVESHFGPRCDEYDPDCACCRAWRWLDTVRLVVGPEMAATPTVMGAGR